jgi:predicted MPP superfamily phosphohydrolase
MPWWTAIAFRAIVLWLVLVNVAVLRVYWRFIGRTRLSPRLKGIARGVVIGLGASMNVYNGAMILAGGRIPKLPELSLSTLGIVVYAWQVTILLTAIALAVGTIIQYLWRGGVWLLRRLTPEGTSSPVPERPGAPAVIERRAFLRRAAYGLPPALFAATGAGMFTSQGNWEINEQDIPIAGLPPKLDGFTIIQLSDLHVGRFFSVRDLDRAVDLANDLAGDLVAVTGDVVNNSNAYLPYCQRALGRLRAPYGVIACPGNHDYIDDGPALFHGMREAGVEVLIDEHRDLDVNGATLRVACVDYPFWARRSGRRRPMGVSLAGALAGAEGPAPTVLLAHHPTTFASAQKEGIALTLAGHTHGGQIIVPTLAGPFNVFGSLITPWPRGYYREGESHLYVSSGLGAWFPLRVNCPPEVARLVLRRA